MEKEKPSFVADRMLGKLSKWLRILGFDTIYSNSWDSEELKEKARAGNRILLTRNTRLFRELPGGSPAIFIESDSFWHQLRQVVSALGLKPGAADFFTRCSRCNARLEELPRAEVASRVPDYVLQTQEFFSGCPACGRIYWSGTHREMAEEMLRDIISPSGEDPE